MNECENGSLNSCNATLLEVCINTPGSFDCNCPLGYSRQNSTDSCTGNQWIKSVKMLALQEMSNTVYGP